MTHTILSLLTAASFIGMASTSFARGEDDPVVDAPVIVDGFLIVREYPLDPSLQQVVIRGDAARYMYDSLSEAPEATEVRFNGSVYKTRTATGMGCSMSNIFAIPHFACAIFFHADGTQLPGVIDPEFGGQARIGVGNGG